MGKGRSARVSASGRGVVPRAIQNASGLFVRVKVKLASGVLRRPRFASKQVLEMTGDQVEVKYRTISIAFSGLVVEEYLSRRC